MIDFVIRWRWAVIGIAAVVVVWVFFPWNRLVTNHLPQPLRPLSVAIGKLFPYQNLGSEFMPPLYEGDLLYMPTTFPGISTTKARQILQQTDQIIKSFPEVHHVFGKIGRAETATDPAPMDMIETTIMLKDEKDWPKVDIKDANGKVIAHRRRTIEELTNDLNAAVQFPGLNNAWTMPIKTRIDMLATGIKTPVGIKVAGPDLARTRAHRRGNRNSGPAGAGHVERIRRARDGRQLHRVQHQSRRDRALRPCRRRRAGSARSGAGRHAADDHGGRPRALQHQSSLRS